MSTSVFDASKMSSMKVFLDTLTNKDITKNLTEDKIEVYFELLAEMKIATPNELSNVQKNEFFARLDEDKFTDGSLKNLRVMKLKQQIRDVEKNTKKNPLEKLNYKKDLEKRLKAALENRDGKAKNEQTDKDMVEESKEGTQLKLDNLHKQKERVMFLLDKIVASNSTGKKVKVDMLIAKKKKISADIASLKAKTNINESFDSEVNMDAYLGMMGYSKVGPKKYFNKKDKSSAVITIENNRTVVTITDVDNTSISLKMMPSEHQK